MRVFLFRVFNRTFGIVFRGIQNTLIQKTTPAGLHYIVNQMALQDSAEYAITHFSEALIFKKRETLWNYCIKRISELQNKVEIIAEFGVWRGNSINYFAKKCPNANVYGFDSFEGLEEDWSGYVLPKGTFSTKGNIPKCEKNIKLFKGWFEETVPKFRQELNDSKIQILHIDSDTYKPAAYVLGALYKNLGVGTIVIFDQYFGYPNFRSHEFKAWKDFVNSNGIEYRYIGYTEMQVALEIKSIH